MEDDLHPPHPRVPGRITRRTGIRLARHNRMSVIAPGELHRVTGMSSPGTAAKVAAMRQLGRLCFTPGTITITRT